MSKAIRPRAYHKINEKERALEKVLKIPFLV
jgi:hypothetical protein